jgi:hypothetical protein
VLGEPAGAAPSGPERDQTAAGLRLRHSRLCSCHLRHQKFSFNFNRCVLKVQLQIGTLIRCHTVPSWTFAVVAEVSDSLSLPRFQVHLAHRFSPTIQAHLSILPFDADYR